MPSNTSPRIDIRQLTPNALEPILALEKYIHSLGLDNVLIELMKLRASQINGCAYCVDMHSRRLRELGEPHERIDGMAAWAEGPFFNEWERAALAWTESVTLLSRDHVPDEVFQEARAHFSEAELVNLTLVVATINVWNRLAVSFRTVPEGYRRMKQTAG